MHRYSTLRRCATSAADTPGSLTAWLAKLSREVRQLPCATKIPSGEPGGSGRVWSELEQVSAHAQALKETDSVLALVNELMTKGYYPSAERDDTTACVPASLPTSSPVRWSTLADRLLMFARIEASSVLSYPGTPESELRRRRGQARAEDSYSVPCSRETLVMTGGVIPLSARLPCEDGEATAAFLSHFCDYLQLVEPRKVLPEVERMNGSLVRVLSRNAPTIVFEAVADAFARYLGFLYRLDAEAEDQSGDLEGTAVLLPFVTNLCKGVTHKALGARLSAVGVAFIMEETRLKSLEEAQATGSSVGMQHLLSSQQFFRESQHAQLLQLQLVRVASKALYEHYDRAPSKLGRSAPAPVKAAFAPVYAPVPMAPLLDSFFAFVDAVFQYNATHGNALQLQDAFQEEVKNDLSLATLRALRVEATAPDQFLRRSMEVLDRCAPSMAVEGELIAGKVALFDFFELNDEGRAALYEDLVTSLRHLVDLRPRGSMFSTSPEEAAGEVERPDTSSEDGLGSFSAAAGAGTTMDATSQRIMQMAHEEVIRVLCDSLDAARIDEAYGIVVAHKYHGLIVTTEVIRPLMRVMSRRGDCRVFNLVDLCVLYSNSTVDMASVAWLFRACAVAGDHYRARTLLQLLEDVVPGFLIKAPPEVKDSLKELKVLTTEPFHLFVSEEEKLVRAAIAGSSGGGGLAAPSADLQELPNVSSHN